MSACRTTASWHQLCLTQKTQGCPSGHLWRAQLFRVATSWVCSTVEGRVNCKRSNNRYKQKRPQLSVFDSGLLSMVSVWSMYLRTSIMQFLSNNQKYSKNTIELPKSYFQILFFFTETLIFSVPLLCIRHVVLIFVHWILREIKVAVPLLLYLYYNKPLLAICFPFK